jgi:GGDEF domain-containing protein
VITHQALHDQLTGLPNRGRFTAELRAAVAQARDARRLAGLFYLDGDEFAVLVSGVSEAEIDGVSERLARGFEEPFEVAVVRVIVSASIGRSTYPADAPDADGLLRRADEAMFAQKRGRAGARRSAAPPLPA